MTNREFYNAIIALDVNDEIKDFAQSAIAKMDARNAKRTSKPSKRTVENEPVKEAILKVLAEGNPMTASDIGKTLEITTQKASGLCVRMVKDGLIGVEEVKIPKVGVRKVYGLVKEGE